MLVLTADDVARLTNMKDLIQEIERTFLMSHQGETVMPPKVYIERPGFNGDFRAMPSRVGQAAGIKWVNSHPDNPATHGLPTVMGIFVLSDFLTGQALAVMDGTVLTKLRTAAASAVATRHLARSNARTLGIIGCGAQAKPHVEAMRCVRTFDEIRLCDNDTDLARRLAAWAGESSRITDIAEACASDVVVTLTPCRTPVVSREWIRPGTHINAVGADAEGKQELQTSILQSARVFVDELVQAVHSGEVNVPIHNGDYKQQEIAGTLAQIVAGEVSGRTGPDDITVFDSTGLAIEDLAAAVLVHRRALREGVGRNIAIVGLEQ